MNIIGIIPARMASSRFPGKPLADIMGKAMIHHVYLRSSMAPSVSEVYIATCDDEIRDYCVKRGLNVVMTKNTHERASDRASEAMVKIEKKTGKKIDIVVMIQGDEPMIYPEMVEEALRPMIEDNSIDVVNLMGRLKTKEEHEDPHEVKVVVNKNNFALYFSREPIPSRKKGCEDVITYKQICVIPFKRDFLIKFNNLKPTPLEIIESVDMLRILENGYGVKMVPVEYGTYSVDTIEDLEKVRKLMVKDRLVESYSGRASHERRRDKTAGYIQ